MIEMREGTLDGHPVRPVDRRSLQMDIVDFFGALHARLDRDGRPDAGG